MLETAVVIKANEKTATIRVGRSTACGECGKCLIGKNNITVDANVENTLNVTPGDNVAVELSLGGIMSASWYMYGIPLVAFVAGCLFGYYILAPKLNLSADLTGFCLGLLLTAAAYITLKIADNTGAFKEKYRITMIKKL